MTDVKTEDEIATVTIRHGKANALDITLCEGLADCFDSSAMRDRQRAMLSRVLHTQCSIPADRK
jgi:enoyl-CoA hydratase/carnithine racemase